MDLPYQETFSPSRLHWSWRIGTTASADFWRHEPSCLGLSRLSGKPYSRVRVQISPNKNVNFRCTSSPSTLESVGNGFVVHGQLTSGSL